MHQQLLFLAHALPHPFLKLPAARPLGSSIGLHRGTIGRKQGLAAHIAHEERPLLTQQTGGRREHLDEIVHRGEVLDHRVDDDDIDAISGETPHLVRGLLDHLDLREATPLCFLLDQSHRLSREIGSQVRLAMWGQPIEQQARTTTDLQHPTGMKRQDALHRLFHMLLHLLSRDRLSRIAAVPADDIEIGGKAGSSLIGFVVEQLPLADLFLPPGVAEGLGGLEMWIGDHVGHQLSLTRSVLAHHRHRLTHGCIPVQHRLDLSQFDTIAPDLHLLVYATQELDLAIGSIAHQVAGAIETIAGLTAKGVRNEALSSQFGSHEVPTSQAHPTNAKLARDTNRNGLAALIQNIYLHIIDLPSNGGHALRTLINANRTRSGHNRILSRAIVVDQWERQRRGGIQVQLVATGQQETQSHLFGPGEFQHTFSQRSRYKTDRDGMLIKPGDQLIGDQARLLIEQ
ncbi:hypothetical protein ccbrp13_32890 [Ktedonobacteria bacterium brp13]|nr:hypothetical protein ccbrp13_32890 [Ktedonobacteria bacterium brp13]